MPLLLLAAFIGVPILEIATFIQVGELIGLWPTLAAVVITAVVGTILLKWQGLTTLNRLRVDLDAGRLPVEAAFDGICLLFAGALLLTPGFITDGFGLLLFVPPFRRYLRRVLEAHLKRAEARRKAHRGGPDGTPGGVVIDAEFTEVDPKAEERPPEEPTDKTRISPPYRD